MPRSRQRGTGPQPGLVALLALALVLLAVVVELGLVDRDVGGRGESARGPDGALPATGETVVVDFLDAVPSRPVIIGRAGGRGQP